MKILLPVDDSAASRAALDFVAARAACLQERPELRLLNVQLPIPPRAARAVGREIVRGYHQAEAAAVLEPAAQRLRAAGLRPKARHAVGNPSDVVGRAAMQGHPDLVVMGSRGHSALKGLVFGSVTQGVLAASTTPLLVLPEGAPPPQQASLNVAIAVDGSRDSLAAVRFVLAHPDLFGPAPRYRLLHVAHAADGTSFDEVMRQALAPFARANVAVESVRLEGSNPGDAIAAYLARSNADLVVMGSHGRGAFKQLVLGSVATRVAARCRLPLLLVRARARLVQAASRKREPSPAQALAA